MKLKVLIASIVITVSSTANVHAALFVGHGDELHADALQRHRHAMDAHPVAQLVAHLLVRLLRMMRERVERSESVSVSRIGEAKMLMCVGREKRASEGAVSEG